VAGGAFKVPEGVLSFCDDLHIAGATGERQGPVSRRACALELALRGPSDWSDGERELFAAFVSSLNQCVF